MFSQLSWGPDGIFPKEKRRRRNRVDGDQRSTSKQSNSGKKVMEKNDDQTDDDLAAIQKATEIAIGTVTHHTKAEKEKIMQNTSEVRVREEAQQRSRGKQQSSGKITFLIRTVAEIIYRRMHRPYQKPRSPTRWPWWTRCKDGLKKVGWGRHSLRVCGITLKPHCVMDSDGNMKTEGRCS